MKCYECSGKVTFEEVLEVDNMIRYNMEDLDGSFSAHFTNCHFQKDEMHNHPGEIDPEFFNIMNLCKSCFYGLIALYKLKIAKNQAFYYAFSNIHGESAIYEYWEDLQNDNAQWEYCKKYNDNSDLFCAGILIEVPNFNVNYPFRKYVNNENNSDLQEWEFIIDENANRNFDHYYIGIDLLCCNPSEAEKSVKSLVLEDSNFFCEVNNGQFHFFVDIPLSEKIDETFQELKKSNYTVKVSYF